MTLSVGFFFPLCEGNENWNLHLFISLFSTPLFTPHDLKSITVTFVFKHLQMYIYFHGIFVQYCALLHILLEI